MVTRSEAQLADVLSEFAHTLNTDFSIGPILDQLLHRIVDVLPITSAGVSLRATATSASHLAGSDVTALRCEELQRDYAEGPSITAAHSGSPVAVSDLRLDSRFPRFTPHALELGMEAAFAFPLLHGPEQLGELDLYRDTPGPLDANATSAAETFADITAAYLLNARARENLRDSAAESRDIASHDALTGLPNRVLFLERLEHAVLRGRRSGGMAAVLFADLDHFKLINDEYGHQVGDQLLVELAQRLRAALRSGDTVARMSGDEFVILCEDLDLDSAPLVDAIAIRIGEAVAQPFNLSGHDVNITASVGIAFSDWGDELSEHLLRDADAAMYIAKRDGGDRHHMAKVSERYAAHEGTTLEHDLRGAAVRGELRTEYQPIVHASDGRMAGVEALVRWAHPVRGLVAPTLLVPAAERSGLIAEIGDWVLERSCSDRHRWNDDQSRLLTMSVNVSAHQLVSPGYSATVAAALAESGTDPELLTLEVTESVYVQEGERALATFAELKDLGLKLALDDFGTGYSSLSYLKRFPIDVVKIDQGFVADLDRSQASFAIISAVIDLAHMMGMTVVAEGVETAEQYEQLAAMGCDFCQGFYFARPMPATDLDALVLGCNFGGSVHLPTLSTTNPRESFGSEAI